MIDGGKARLIRQQLHSCAHKIRHAYGVLRGPSRDFADRKRCSPRSSVDQQGVAVLRKVCDRYFGQPRQSGSHQFYRTPWQGEPLVNIQRIKGMARPCQVR